MSTHYVNYKSQAKPETMTVLLPHFYLFTVLMHKIPDLEVLLLKSIPLRNDANGRLYTDKFSIRVLGLNNVPLATDEDKRYNIDKWSILYKSSTWEDIKMVASKDPAIFAAANTIYKLSEDERIRQQCEAREDFLRRELATQREHEELLAQLAQKNDQLARQADEIAHLKALLAEKEK